MCVMQMSGMATAAPEPDRSEAALCHYVGRYLGLYDGCFRVQSTGVRRERQCLSFSLSFYACISLIYTLT